jgi:hypothetical protein
MKTQSLAATLFYTELSILMYRNIQARVIQNKEQALSQVDPSARYRHNGRCCSLQSRVRRAIANRKRKLELAETKISALFR